MPEKKRIVLMLTKQEAEAIDRLILAGEGFYFEQYEYRNDLINEMLKLGDRVRWEITGQAQETGE